jgi:hypothetical protein
MGLATGHSLLTKCPQSIVLGTGVASSAEKGGIIILILLLIKIIGLRKKRISYF